MKRKEWSPPRPHIAGMCFDSWCEEGCAEMRARAAKASKPATDRAMEPWGVKGATLEAQERAKETVYQSPVEEPQSGWLWLLERFGLR